MIRTENTFSRYSRDKIVKYSRAVTSGSSWSSTGCVQLKERTHNIYTPFSVATVLFSLQNMLLWCRYVLVICERYWKLLFCPAFLYLKSDTTGSPRVTNVQITYNPCLRMNPLPSPFPPTSVTFITIKIRVVCVKEIDSILRGASNHCACRTVPTYVQIPVMHRRKRSYFVNRDCLCLDDMDYHVNNSDKGNNNMQQSPVASVMDIRRREWNTGNKKNERK